MNNTATLSNKDNYTIFSFKDKIIKFITPEILEYYTEVLHWDNGYIVVNAKYKNMPVTEEYIDLIPILENLYIDPNEFCKNIEKVAIKYD